MSQKEKEFQKKLLETFKAEAQEHLGTISAGLVELEKMPSAEVQQEIVEAIFRDSHSLKGASRAVNVQEIEAICQAVENIFAHWKKKGVSGPSSAFDTLFKAVEVIRSVLASVETEDKPDAEKVKGIISELSSMDAAAGQPLAAPAGRLKREAAPGEAQKPSFSDGARAPDTIRVSTSKLNSLYLQAEEMIGAKLSARQNAAQVREMAGMIASLRENLAKVYSDAAPSRLSARTAASGRVPEFLGWAQSWVRSMEAKLNEAARSAAGFSRGLDRMVDGLLDDVKRAMMQPFSFLLDSLPMLVRDISHAQGKDVDLIIRGESIEIDRRILDEMKDPLIHIIRNCLDHGLESPQARLKARKPVKGRISVIVSHIEGNRVEISIKDDGAGINIPSIREAALKAGLLNPDALNDLSDEEALNLVFQSGISTTPIITEISGRGLGLAIVKEKTEKLGGAVSIETAPDAGTTFRIKLPLTLTTFRGVLVRSAGQVFVVPARAVDRTLRLKDADIKTVENRETIPLGFKTVSFVRLCEVLGAGAGRKAEAKNGLTSVIVINDSERRIAFGVEEVMEEQEVLVKTLGKQLVRVRNISGAALLGSGKPVPILNVKDLIDTAVRTSGGTPRQAAPATEEARKSILVAEDSITSRILIKNILESAGYSVKTAVDGLDALTSLKTGDFDMVISDIEMPRMNGFELTAKIRSDARYAELPVVLVTGLETREDRERGIEAGANAYIVKSSFDQGNLLEIVKRLI